MSTCYDVVTPPHTGAIRGKLEGPRRVRDNAQTCMNFAPPTLDTKREITTQSPQVHGNQIGPPTEKNGKAEKPGDYGKNIRNLREAA